MRGNHERANDIRLLIVPILQTFVLITCIVSVTVLGVQKVVDAAAITAIVGAIAGSVGVLAGVSVGARHAEAINGNGDKAGS